MTKKYVRLPPKLAALEDLDARVRTYATYALGKIGDPRAVEPLIKALKDEEYDVRRAAAEVLCKFSASAVEPLIAALVAEKIDVRDGAAKVLGEIGDLRAVEPLAVALKDDKEYIRQAAAFALCELGDSRAVEPLINALKDEKWYVRKAAANALDKIGWLPDDGADGAAYWVAKEKWDRCVKIGALAVEPLIAVLKNVVWQEVRQAAAKTLGKIGDLRAVVPLIAALEDLDARVRAAAAKALGEIGDPCAVEPLIAALNDEETDVRCAAANALVGLYQTGHLDSICQQNILSKRHMIEDRHSDNIIGSDYSDCHRDSGTHRDNKGIGVSFPV